MAETIMSTIVHLIITLLVVKLYTDITVKKKGQTDQKMTWKDASEVIEKLEKRISQLQERDALSQEKIWNLEDQNRILKLHLLEMKREVAAKSMPSSPFTSKLGSDD
jgi:Co/Zn/Cd efflux system component